jgi:hypothetical protein
MTIATVNIAYGKENAELAANNKLNVSEYDTICFESVEEAHAYCAGVADGASYDAIHTDIEIVEIQRK